MSRGDGIVLGRSPSSWIGTLGLVVALSTFAVGMLFLMSEAPELYRKGASAFAADATLRVVSGVLISAFAFAPYAVLGFSSRRTQFPRSALAVAAAVFLADMGLRTKAIFFASSSTEPIAVLFLPLWLSALAIAVWLVFEFLNVVRRTSRNG